MTKYKQYYQQMVNEHEALFTEFRTIHAQFVENRVQWNEAFNKVGQQVVDIIREWDRRLCSGMGKGQYSGYSHRLSEKFWAEVKKDFSHIDMVGVKIKMSTPQT